MNLITYHELQKMRREVNARDPLAKFFNPVPQGREYWDIERLVETLEHYMGVVGSPDSATAARLLSPSPLGLALGWAIFEKTNGVWAPIIQTVRRTRQEAIAAVRLTVGVDNSQKSWPFLKTHYGFRAARILVAYDDNQEEWE